MTIDLDAIRARADAAPHQPGGMCSPHRATLDDTLVLLAEVGRLRWALDRAGISDQRCHWAIGSKPGLVIWSQCDPCRCELPSEHDGLHWCHHMGQPRPVPAQNDGLGATP